MKTIWTQHLKDPEEKKRYESSLRNSKWILDDLSALLDRMEEDLTKADINTKTYEVPNWAYRQAHNNGARQYVRLIKRLINLDQKDEQ